MDELNKYKNKAHNLIPGGAHTYSRGDDQYPINAPSVFERGDGAYIFDVEGNRLLDYGMALRAVTIGYGNKTISNAAIEQIRYGNNLTKASKIEVDAAEKMVDLIDGMDMVKFAKNGSTVTTAAVKLARAYTGRDIVVRCAQHPFFSYDDWFIGSTVMNAGVPDAIQSLTLQFDYNDIASLETLFDENKDSIACIIMEPATSEHPQNGHLNRIKELCHKNGAIFILDEMITGFRWDLKGAQHYYGVVPDLCTFGKGMANGFSVAALMGKREIMQLGGLSHEQERVFLISTTHGAEMSGLGALSSTIDFYRENDVIGHFWDYGKNLKQSINRLAGQLGLEDFFSVDGIDVSPNFITKDENGEMSLAYRTLFVQEMIKHGVFMPWIALSYSHGTQEMALTIEAVEKALVTYKKALENGVGQYLKGRIIKPVFRKYN